MSGSAGDHADLRTLVERNEGRPLGLSGAFLPKGTLAIANATTIILIDFAGDKNNGRANSSNPSLTTQWRDYLRDHALGGAYPHRLWRWLPFQALINRV
jgi:hypothetical protein